MDAVITYVDGNDALWQRDYRSVVPDAPVARRYRDWGTLPFLLRGIERHMPFIDRVFLVVARESQVPAWAERAHLQVVLHADIIPSAWLPTFNSTTIELFLHRIPGLSERFLYFNDDVFPVLDVSETDFFPEGRPAIGFARHLLAGNLFKRQTRNADVLARQALGLRPGLLFLRPQHTCTPLLRSACETVFDRVEPGLSGTITPVRDAKNVNQYLFSDYQYLNGLAVSRRAPSRHLSLKAVSPATLGKAILQPRQKILCLNDVDMTQQRFETLRAAMQAAFLARFPVKSRYER